LLLLLPPLFSYADADCFNASVRFMCGDQDYYGPVVVSLWDDNFFFFGGDEKIFTEHHLIPEDRKGKPIDIVDPRNAECMWFNNPYQVFISFCAVDLWLKGPNVDKEWWDYFSKNFGANNKYRSPFKHLYSTCKKIPHNTGKITIVKLNKNDEC
ncbi:hypothetical protein PENTCL1PPCAC_28582, partial [Pristionchus entomophagus]